jgi:hypothetical protein
MSVGAAAMWQEICDIQSLASNVTAIESGRDSIRDHEEDALQSPLPCAAHTADGGGDAKHPNQMALKGQEC